MADEIEFTAGSGNVFADLGFADPKAELAKAGERSAILDAIGEVIASFMKRDTLDHYRRERDERVGLSDARCTGHYEGCVAEANEFVKRLRVRGFAVVRVEEPRS